MKAKTTAHARQRLPLRGYERTLTMVDGVSTAIVHSMLVRSPKSTILRNLATAVQNTFNLHPRMRSLQLKGEPFLAEIHPSLTRQDVTSFALVRVRMISSLASDADDMMIGWQQYTDDECSIGFDRFKQLPVREIGSDRLIGSDPRVVTPSSSLESRGLIWYASSLTHSAVAGNS